MTRYFNTLNIALITAGATWLLIGLGVTGLLLLGISSEGQAVAECLECSAIAKSYDRKPADVCDVATWQDEVGGGAGDSAASDGAMSMGGVCDSLGERVRLFIVLFWALWGAISHGRHYRSAPPPPPQLTGVAIGVGEDANRLTPSPGG